MLQNQGPFRRHASGGAIVSELSHPSGVLPETSQFQRRRWSSEMLPNQLVEGRYNASRLDTHSTFVIIPDIFRECFQQRDHFILGFPQCVQYRVFEALAATRQRDGGRLPPRRDDFAGDKSQDLVHVEAGVHRSWRTRLTPHR